MENKDTNTYYQKVIRVGEEKWEIVEITIGIIFLFEISIHYFLYREFSSPTWKKSPPPKVPIPTQNPNLTKSLPYKPFEKWLNLPSLRWISPDGWCTRFDIYYYILFYAIFILSY